MGKGTTGKPVLRTWLLRFAPLWCALVFILLQLTAAQQEPRFNDTYRYAVQTLEFLGVPKQEAHEQSVRVHCQRIAKIQERSRSLDPWRRYNTSPNVTNAVNSCVAASPTTLAPSSPRYAAIFETRPGFPLLAAPFVKVFGLNKGLLLVSAVLGAASGLVVYLLMLLVGVPRGPALLAQVLYYALPTGYWAARTLSEGSMMIATVATLIGAWILLQRRIAMGLAVTAIAGFFGFTVKYSQVPMLGIALTAAAVGIWIFDRQRRHAGTVVLGLCSLGALAAGLLIPKVLGWPRFEDSLQDTFTDHFQKGPDVSDPYRRLIDLNGAFWSQWFQEQAMKPLLLLATIAGAVALWRWSRSLALIVMGAAATGIATEIAHPAWVEGDRLYFQLWLVAVCGLPLLWPLIQRSRDGALQRQLEPTMAGLGSAGLSMAGPDAAGIGSTARIGSAGPDAAGLGTAGPVRASSAGSRPAASPQPFEQQGPNGTTNPTSDRADDSTSSPG